MRLPVPSSDEVLSKDTIRQSYSSLFQVAVNMDGLRTNSHSGASFELDEGFAEDSQHNGDQVQNSFVAWLNTQSAHAKADIAYEILRTLRSTEIAAVVSRLNPLLHMDPVELLPPEITSQVFSYLDASTLLTASLLSTTWRQRILDPKLWQDLYHSQGWGINLDAVRAFEDAHAEVVRSEFRKAGAEIRTSSIYKQRPSSKRRATSAWLQSTPRRVSADVDGWREQHGAIEADIDPMIDGPQEEMPDYHEHSPQRPNKRQSQDSGDEMDLTVDTPSFSQTAVTSSLMRYDEQGRPYLNWQHLYKQRQLLEQNWRKGRFVSFQLPHPDYAWEAHEECVYTIQFQGKWLVSGSRDRSLRIWDLDTRRLRGKPLLGHSQSVLCLQFDPAPDQDIIISGSSDCSIILWRFSTGQKLQHISRAHSESVLNLQFDHRYLVTCSKDKNIKIWNRNNLLPNDPDYPTARNGQNCSVPSHILNLSKIEPSLLEAGMANGTYRALKPFSHLMTLEGHAAAVNAIQLHGSKVVSASGDRTIRIWDLTTGICTKVIIGHQKGIACVQYDGKRVVSGSSDNTIRIYDPLTGTEVATLLGHDDLVRTVQAGFGDISGSELEESAAARAAERRYIEDLEAGRVIEDRHYNRRVRNGEFGSSRISMGSNLPPGGGGGKWARIVSGSYDQSIIIWNKNETGDWVPGQVLKQGSETSLDSNPSVASRPHRNRMRLRHNDDLARQSLNNQNRHAPTDNGISTSSETAGQGTANGNNENLSTQQIMQAAVQTSISSLHTTISNVAGLNRMAGGHNVTTSNIARTAIQNAVSQITASVQSATQNAVQNAITNVIVSGQDNPINNSTVNTSSMNILQTPPNQQMQMPPAPGVGARVHRNTAHRHNVQGSGQHASRIFKLQFDTRRIVCCSQDSRIIGWDFANAEEDIEEASKFFLGP